MAATLARTLGQVVELICRPEKAVGEADKVSSILLGSRLAKAPPETRLKASEHIPLKWSYPVRRSYLVEGGTGPGLAYRERRRLEALAEGADRLAPWGSTVQGVDQGDGWVKVGTRYLPVELDGGAVLHLRPEASAKKVEKVASLPCRRPLQERSQALAKKRATLPCHVPLQERSQVGRLWAAGHSIAKAGGTQNEDAFFADATGLGVADGVGSMTAFEPLGMDVAAYSAELMSLARQALRTPGATAASALEAAEVGATAYGASTATVVQVTAAGLQAANLGDSGFMLCRRQAASGLFEVVLQSEEQVHRFNYPYQLTRLSPDLAERLPNVDMDSAADCQLYNAPLQEGDLLLVYTDGFRDNLFKLEILSLLQCHAGCRGGSLRASPSGLSRALAEAAARRARDPAAATPFGEAAKADGYSHQGGKPDDVTVVAAWITS